MITAETLRRGEGQEIGEAVGADSWLTGTRLEPYATLQQPTAPSASSARKPHGAKLNSKILRTPDGLVLTERLCVSAVIGN